MLLNKLTSPIKRLAVVGLAASLSAGSISKADGDDESSEWPVARGVVVDEEGRPVEGVEVEAINSADRISGRTDPEGRFALTIRRPELRGTGVVASTAGAERMGFAGYPIFPTSSEPPAPLRIVLKPARAIAAKVVDADGEPIADASVEVIGGLRSLCLARTDPDGRVAFRLPVEAPVGAVVALKAGAGFDYFEHARWRDDRPASELPYEVTLTLDGARTAQVRAVDSDGDPIAGAEYYPWLIQRPGKLESVNLSGSRLVHRETDADGIATFDFLPTKTDQPISIMPHAEGYRAAKSTSLNPDQPTGTTLGSELLRKGSIEGRVRRPDGEWAEGIRVIAEGEGRGFGNHDRREARTAADGTFKLTVNPEAAYIVAVVDDQLGAPTSEMVVVLEGEEIGGIDFELAPAAIIQGTLVIEPDAKPAEGEQLQLVQVAGQMPDSLKEADDNFSHAVQLSRWTRTDAEGRYEFHVGPGTFELRGPTRTEPVTVETVEGGSYRFDFQMPRPEQGPIAGRVVLASDPDRSIAGAIVKGVSGESVVNPELKAETDADGRFETERYLDKMTVFAKSADGSLAGIVEIRGDTTEFVLPIGPTAEAKGVALDESGAPMANRRLDCGTPVYFNEDSWSDQFVPPVITDAEGRFTVPGMVLGRTYTVSVLEGNRYSTFTEITPTEPGPIDLGRLIAGAYHRPPSAEVTSSFRRDAPEVGDPAPAIEATTLEAEPLMWADFEGKYVLIDFWATWCGPCIAELPLLQEVHDRYGADDRFAMLSLSVDEAIAEPRAFQEKRKLPWTQGFVGDGVGGPVPDAFGVRAIPALVLIGPDGTIVARGMRGEAILGAVREAMEGH